MGPEDFWRGEWWLFPIVIYLAMVVIFAAIYCFVFERSGFRLPWRNEPAKPASRSVHREAAIEVLGKRYASEISREEFEPTKKDIQG